MGTLAAQKDPLDRTIAYSYDAAARLTKTDYPNDTDVEIAYDESGTTSLTDCRTASSITWPSNRYGKGRRTKIIDASGTHYFNYDAHGRLASHYDQRTLEQEGCARVWTYTYDSAGRLESQRYPTGREVLYTYAGADPERPSKIQVKRRVNSTWQTDTVADPITWGPRGQLLSVKLANGILNEYRWDYSGAPLARYGKYGGSTLHKREVASRDALGNPTAIDGRTTSPAGQLNEDFAYDADFHVLTEAKVDSYGTLSPYREYDYTVQQSLLGDRSTAVEKTDGSGGTLDWTHEYVGGASRLARLLLTHGTDEYKFEMTHDAAGRLGRIDYYARVDGQWVSEAYETFGYDEAGRRNAFLLEHRKQGASVYDWADLRTRLVEGVNQAKTDFWYERSGELVAELRLPPSP